MVLKDVRPIISELVSIKNSIPLTEDVGRYLPDVRKNVHGEGVRCGIKNALRLIELAPTIEAEPVRHGRWIDRPTTIKYISHSECSACGSWQGANWMNYCPHCGAKMDGGE